MAECLVLDAFHFVSCEMLPFSVGTFTTGFEREEVVPLGLGS